ncbi:HAMP domain-containing histidine kinase [Spirosoma sp. BT702]|uniref:histidine kinase n=1 Tax=Spirosoma profusum TaxID=2771354 RepID=A0A926XYH0_9BACT|nr:HAMP domain-containing sensor histidine kinase [Spirosoma profusum]MBD2702466.1 HAMP domain-containing histidine kinase [Spirosoma profusum]
MESSYADNPQSLSAITAYLFAQRETVLNSWRTACQGDATLSKGLSLSREEFNNLLPLILDILEARLLGKAPEADPALTAQAHGLHRWQKSFSLIDTMREVAHLTQILYTELKRFQALFPQTDAHLLLDVNQQISQIMQEAMEGSVVKYDDLQRLEATQRSAALQQAVDKMTALSQERITILRTSAHDLQGGLGIINGAAYMLKLEGLSEEQREQYLDMLSRNLASVETMLTNLMDLSRLEAGEEKLQFKTMDVAPFLHEIVQSGQALAAERKLLLRAEGPASLLAETDPVKLQRIIQNLLLNALKYTSTGFISISWALENDARWIVSIQDSGPGLPSALATVFGDLLKPTVEATSVLSVDAAEPVAVLPINVPTIPPSEELRVMGHQANQGEGIGLQIVKRLCELLKASLEIESITGRGTLFRVRLPIRYSAKQTGDDTNGSV